MAEHNRYVAYPKASLAIAMGVVEPYPIYRSDPSSILFDNTVPKPYGDASHASIKYFDVSKCTNTVDDTSRLLAHGGGGGGGRRGVL